MSPFHIFKVSTSKRNRKASKVKRKVIYSNPNLFFQYLILLILKQRTYPTLTDNVHCNLIRHWNTYFKNINWQHYLYQANWSETKPSRFKIKIHFIKMFLRFEVSFYIRWRKKLLFSYLQNKTHCQSESKLWFYHVFNNVMNKNNNNTAHRGRFTLYQHYALHFHILSIMFLTILQYQSCYSLYRVKKTETYEKFICSRNGIWDGIQTTSLKPLFILPTRYCCICWYKLFLLCIEPINFVRFWCKYSQKLKDSIFIRTC